MGRGRPLTPGSMGEISIKRLPSGRYQADAWVMTETGDTRRVRRSGDTRRAAELALVSAVRADARPASVKTLADLLQAWLDRHRGITAASRQRYEREIENYIIPRGGKIKIGDLDAGVLQGVLDRITAEVSRDAARHAKGRLGQAFRWAHRVGIVEANHAASLELAREPRVRPVAPQKRQVALLRRLLTADAEKGGGRSGPKDENARMAFEIMTGTGARIGEVCALDWEDVDLENGTITFWDTLVDDAGPHKMRGHLKNQDPYRVSYIPARLQELLAERSRESGPVLATRAGTHTQPGNIRRKWRAVYARAGVDPTDQLTPHDLRRYVATVLTGALGIEEAARQLGDTVAVAERHYIAPTYTGPARAADVLEGL